MMRDEPQDDNVQELEEAEIGLYQQAENQDLQEALSEDTASDKVRFFYHIYLACNSVLVNNITNYLIILGRCSCGPDTGYRLMRIPMQ